jgi:O-acetyl-ADP-ribose deacetylase (regulator of RNase III)
MTIEIIEGDLLNAFDKGEVNIIGHCCNAQGKMNSGIAKSIRERYPAAYERYMVFHKLGSLEVGNCIAANIGWPSDQRYIFNLVGQEFYGYDGKRYLNYGAMGHALQYMSERVAEGEAIGFPYNMGCDRAGGDWGIVLEMIEFYFKDHQVKIYRLGK